MKVLPQLRVRTEFNYGKTFGPIADVAAAIKALGCTHAGIVDGSTWGHVRWAKEAAKADFKPLFGTEVAIPQADGKRPVAWALALDLRKFYAFSTAARREDADLPKLFAEAKGVLRFAGAALTDPACFDCIDLNPASPLQMRRAYALHKKTKKPLVITSDNYYPLPEDHRAFMALIDQARVTPQFIMSEAQLREQFKFLTDAEWRKAVSNTKTCASVCADELRKAPLIKVEGDLDALIEAGKQYRLKAGHIAAWTDVHEARLKRELEMIRSKKYESYFMVVADLITWAKQRMLVGPGRGSSAGSLACYLMRITEVNPLGHDLLFERFIDVNRNDLPDIDIDFNDQKRELVFEYLAQKYTPECVARIGNINTMKPRSVMQRVCRKLGIPDHKRFDVINVLIEYSSGDSRYGKGLEDTLTHTEPGKRFALEFPNAAIMYRLENHASHSGVHAAGVIVCNEPVSEYCTVGPDGVAHIDKPDSEHLNLLKIDALGLRTLGVIEDAGVVTNDELYALKLDDPAVLGIFNQRRYAGIFQFEGQAQRRVAAEVDIKSFRQIDHVTALARPGPLGGGASQRYIARAAGREEVEYRHPTMKNYLGHTLGVVLYQEQVMRICFEIGRFSWEVVSEIRKAMSGRKGKEYFDRRGVEFISGARSLGMKDIDARTIWAEICTFGAWGMNASHTVSYGVISYWCAWMKHYHQLEYAAACLRGAKDDEQTMEVLRDMATEGVPYTAVDLDASDVNWKVVNGRLIGGLQNIHGIGPAKATKIVEERAAGKFTEQKRAAVAALPVKFKELYPLHAAYSHIFADPYAHGCAEGSVISTIDKLPEAGNVLMICQVVRKELRDENETVRLARRNGRKLKGPTIFLDVFVTDDSGVPLTLRVDRFDFEYERPGKIMAEKLQAGDALLVRGHRIPNFAMVKIGRVKCLNRPEIFNETARTETVG